MWRKGLVEELVYFPRDLQAGVAAPFFLLRSSRPPLRLDGAPSADLFVEGDQILAELWKWRNSATSC